MGTSTALKMTTNRLQTLPCACLWTGIKVCRVGKRGDGDRLVSVDLVPGWPLASYRFGGVGEDGKERAIQEYYTLHVIVRKYDPRVRQVYSLPKKIEGIKKKEKD